MNQQSAKPLQSLDVYRSADLIVTEGVARGDTITFADDLVLDDFYTLSAAARPRTLTLGLGPRLKSFRVQAGSGTGTPGNAVALDCCITLMDAHGQTCEALILVEVEESMAQEVYVLPLGDLMPDQPYRLIGVDRHSATKRFAQVACVSFVGGTRITMADGTQRPVEELTPGDMVLTRDNGAQPLRWLGHQTMRATGAFTPVLIRAGALSNDRDLLVSPDHRIMVYQRHDHFGAGRPDVLVKVRHLIDGQQILRREGGFIDYYQMLFDDYEIVFAEGIGCESLLVDTSTEMLLPEELATRITQMGQTDRRTRRYPYEVAEDLLTKPDALALLRKAQSA